MLIAIRPQGLFRWLLVCVAMLVVLHVFAVTAAVAFPSPRHDWMRYLFDLDLENSFPAEFSTLQLLLASVLLLLLFKNARSSFPAESAYWLVLAGVFAFLSMDEQFVIHEHFTGPTKRWLGEARVPDFAWVVPYAAFVAVFAGCFFVFWWRLPREVRWKMAAAASIYVGGALGLELIGSRLAETVGRSSPYYLLEVLVEESMELFGIALFIRTLLQLIQSRVGRLILHSDTRQIESHNELMQDLEAADRRKGERRAG
jgi:hypothetical protein